VAGRIEAPLEELAPDLALVASREDAHRDRRPGVEKPAADGAVIGRRHRDEVAGFGVALDAGDRVSEHPGMAAPQRFRAPRLDSDFAHESPDRTESTPQVETRPNEC
jgi:hypothetical protein